MKLPRRKFLHLAAGVAALPAMPCIATAQAYPSRPVRIVVPFAAAGPNDVIARVVAQRLSEQLGQPFVVENRPGAATNLATQAVIVSPPDGYTVLVVSSPHAINATLFDNFSFNFIRDISPTAGIMRVPNVMVVSQSFPARSVSQFISYAKENPGKVSFASSGVGASNHMSGELFKALTGIHMAHVPYRSSGPALTDLLGGQVQVMFDAITTTIEHIKAGRLRALAVTSATKAESLPDIPVMADFVPGYDVSNWFGFGVARRTPEELIMTLNGAVNAALAEPNMKARLAGLGGILMPGSPADFGKLIVDETEKWAKVIRAANIKPE